ncbi:MAG: hypothetical protein M0R39_12525 [Prolixibacteraceae bacterium]|nr:hypothetical protein [Prolixibacteraceae bacterium]
MTNKEQIQRNIAVAFDIVEQIIDHPELIDKIPDGSVVTFIDEENTKSEKPTSKMTQRKYVKVKRHFEVL